MVSEALAKQSVQRGNVLQSQKAGQLCLLKIVVAEAVAHGDTVAHVGLDNWRGDLPTNAYKSFPMSILFHIILLNIL
jgi:hypothetical protein